MLGIFFFKLASQLKLARAYERAERQASNLARLFYRAKAPLYQASKSQAAWLVSTYGGIAPSIEPSSQKTNGC